MSLDAHRGRAAFVAFFAQAGADAANPTDVWASVLHDGAIAFE